MTLYIIKRLSVGLVTLVVILFICYTLLRLAPGDPTQSSLLGGDGNTVQSEEKQGSAAANIALRERLHLDAPLAVGFLYWAKAVALDGDFGLSASVDQGRPVMALIAEKLPITMKLNIISIILIYLIAIPLGVISGAKVNSIFDKGTNLVMLFFYSLPVIWVALLLQTTLAEGGIWPVLPLRGIGNAGGGIFINSYELLLDGVRYYILPVTALSYAGCATLARYTRNSMMNVLSTDYIRTATAKGLPYHRIVWQHGLRNALISLITIFAGILPGLVAGSIIVEHVFGIPGMGSLSLLALSSRDYPLQMALFFFSGVLTLGGILLADILYMLADPRIRLDKSN